MTTNTGGPAFPSADFEHHEYTGMTLRDYFAAKAMQGCLANSLLGGNTSVDAVAADAYKVADAMLKAREAK
jgi:hypothetical protein